LKIKKEIKRKNSWILPDKVTERIDFRHLRDEVAQKIFIKEYINISIFFCLTHAETDKTSRYSDGLTKKKK